MINIYHSLKIEDLTDKLFENINGEYDDKGPFYSPDIIIPNNNISRYIELTYTRRFGICFNFSFEYLENVLTDLVLNYLNQNEEKENMEFLAHKKNNMILTFLIYYIINIYTDEPELIEVKKFISNSNKEEKVKKLWQMSEKLSGLFREYEYKRKDLINFWLNNKNYYSENKYETFERFIYNKIFDLKKGLIKELEINGKKFSSLFFKSKELKEKQGLNDKKTIHLFSISNISGFHYELINFLSGNNDFNFYLLNFSGKYSGSVNRCFDLLKLKDENYNLISQCKNIKFFNINKKDEKTKSLLQIIQNRLLNKNLFNDEEISQIDKSFRIVGCQGIFRECETVFNSIIYNLKKDENLKLNDIAVLVGDIEKYKPYLLYFFESSNIKYNLIDVNAKNESIFGSAIIFLLNLINGNFTRIEAFDFFYNQCFILKFKLTINEIDDWLKISDSINIFNDYNEDGNFSWNKGLKKISLGLIMDADFSNDEQKYYSSYNGYIPSDISSIYDLKTINNFLSIITKLRFRIKELKNIKNDCGVFIEKFFNFIEDYLEVNDDNIQEKIIKNLLKEKLNDIKSIDCVFGKKDIINFNFIQEIILSVLQSVPAMKGKYMSGGVNISKLNPMRPIPFKIIYMMGLNENEFPGFDDTSYLNLLNQKYETGDLTRTMINKIMFLEIFLSVREKIYFTYINKDIEKDNTLYPSSIINIIIDFINKEIFNDKKILSVIETPLNSDSVKFLDKNENDDIICNYNINDRKVILKKINLFNEEKKVLEYEDNINLKNKFELTLNELSKFIENPIEQSIKKQLGIFDFETNDKMLKDDEPFHEDGLFIYQLYNEILSDYIYKEKFNKEFFNEYIDYNIKTGRICENQFGDKVKKKYENELYNRFNANDVIELINELKDYNKYLYSQNCTKNIFPLSEIVFNEFENTEIIIKANFNLLFEKSNNYKYVIITSASEIKNKYLIKPFLFYMLLLFNKNPVVDFETVIIYKKGSEKIKFDCYDYDYSKKYLKDVIGNYLFNKKEFNYIPVDLIDKNILYIENQKDFYDKFIDLIIDDKESYNSKLASYNDTLNLFDDLTDFVPGNVLEIVNKRINPILKNYILKAE